MERHAVQSSNVMSVGYDASSSTMEVEFKDGAIYQYFDVPQHIYDGLMMAASPGAYLHQNIRGYYAYAKL